MKTSHAGATEALRTTLGILEERVTRWLVRWSITILRVGLGAIFLGFGLLKFFPGLSPAEGLVVQTLDALTFGVIPARVGVVLVAALECSIGLGLITGRFLQLVLVMLGFQMIGAMSPLVLFPAELFGGPFHAPTLEGQYVLKDVVLISAGSVIGATLEGGRIISEHTLGSAEHATPSRGTLHAGYIPSPEQQRDVAHSRQFIGERHKPE